MPRACPPMWNANFMTICSAASWPMDFLRLGCDTCHKELLLACMRVAGGT